MDVGLENEAEVSLSKLTGSPGHQGYQRSGKEMSPGIGRTRGCLKARRNGSKDHAQPRAGATLPVPISCLPFPLSLWGKDLCWFRPGNTRNTRN